MIWLAVGLCILLVILYGYELWRKRTLQSQLVYLQRKLDEIVSQPATPSTEKVLLVTGQSELRGLLRVVNDLLERARKSAADYAETEQAMRKMLSNVSHDLKTPLTVVLGYAEMLERSPDVSAEERQRLLGQIHRKTQEVLALMNAFFDLAKLEADDSGLPLFVLDAAELCRQRVLAYYDLLASEGYEVDIDLPGEPVWVYANEEALTRIVDNLLSNAVRYGAVGGYLGLSAKRSGSSVLIEVADRGPGIPLSEQPRVFERLYTLEDSRNRNVQGSGLGLTITKRLVERLGGSISLRSVPNVRTSFIVKLRWAEGASNRQEGSKKEVRIQT